MSMSDEDLRKIAHRRLKAQANFKTFLGVWAAVSILLIAIWALGGGWGHYFWPIWPIFGMGIAALFMGLDAYGPSNYVTEERIEAEVRRMRGAQGAASYPTAPSATQVYPPHTPEQPFTGQFPDPSAPAQYPTGSDQPIPPQPPLPPQGPEQRS